MKVLRFLGLILALGLASSYLPFGDWISIVVVFYALWNLANNN